MMVKQTHCKTLEFTVLAILSVTMFSRLWTQMAHQPITHTQQQLNTFRHVDMVEDDLQKFTVSTRLAEKGHRSDAAMVVGGAKMGCRSESFTNCCWSTYIFTTSQPPLGFTENKSIKRKHPVNGSCEEEKSLVDGSGSGLRWSCTADAHCCAGKDG